MLSMISEFPKFGEVVTQGTFQGVFHGGAPELTPVFSPMAAAMELDGFAFRRCLEDCETNHFGEEYVNVLLEFLDAVVAFEGLPNHEVDLADHVC